MSLFTSQLEAKKFALLWEMVPAMPRIAMLVNPNNPTAETDIVDVQAAAKAIGQQIDVLRADNERDIDQAFRTMVQQRSDALLVALDPFFNSRREQLVTLAAYHAIPAIYEFREFVVAGGLISYGTKLTDNYRLAGSYAGRILKGARPGDLPVQAPTKFELRSEWRAFARTFQVRGFKSHERKSPPHADRKRDPTSPLRTPAGRGDNRVPSLARFHINENR